MIFGFPNISAWEYRIFKKIVSIRHNYPLIMGDRHNKFEDPIVTTYYLYCLCHFFHFMSCQLMACPFILYHVIYCFWFQIWLFCLWISHKESFWDGSFASREPTIFVSFQHLTVSFMYTNTKSANFTYVPKKTKINCILEINYWVLIF